MKLFVVIMMLAVLTVSAQEDKAKIKSDIKAQADAIRASAGVPIPGDVVQLTADQKLAISLDQRDILVAKTDQSTLSKQYDSDSAKIAAANTALNAKIDKARKELKLPDNTQFDQDKLVFIKTPAPPAAAEKK